MTTNSDDQVEVKICKKQTTIPEHMREQVLQQLNDICGQPKEHYQLSTKYRHSNRPIQVIIDEPRINPENKFTLTTITGYSKDSSIAQNCSVQQAIISNVEGEIHDLISSLGLQVHHSWVEKGFIFTQDSLTVKVFSVFSIPNEEPIDPDNLAVSIESISSLATPQIRNACQRIGDVYKKILNDRVPYTGKPD